MPSQEAPGVFVEWTESEVYELLTKKPTTSGGNPYKVLYWMGAGVAVLLIGVVALALLMKTAPYVPADPERTLLWIYEAGNPGGPGALTVIEESRSRSALTAVPFPAPEAARTVYAEQGGRRAAENVAALLQRRIHHRVFLPLTVVSTLIDAAGGISVEGKELNGSAAMAYLREGGYQGARRATLVMLALSEAVSTRGVNMGVSQGLSLAQQVDTDLDLTAIPDVLGRWSSFAAPRVTAPSGADAAALQKLFLPDPAETGAK